MNYNICYVFFQSVVNEIFYFKKDFTFLLPVFSSVEVILHCASLENANPKQMIF